MMPQCPKAMTVALKHENAFATQTAATIAKTDGRGLFWPKVGSCWQKPKRSRRTEPKQTKVPLNTIRLSLSILGVFADVVCIEKPAEAQNGAQYMARWVAGIADSQHCNNAWPTCVGLAGTVDPAVLARGHRVFSSTSRVQPLLRACSAGRVPIQRQPYPRRRRPMISEGALECWRPRSSRLGRVQDGAAL
jgi:hypothetical protein